MSENALHRHPRYAPGDYVVRRALDPDPSLLVIWTVREFNPASGFYVVDGNIGGNWPAVRAFTEEEIRAWDPAQDC